MEQLNTIHLTHEQTDIVRDALWIMLSDKKTTDENVIAKLHEMIAKIEKML